MTTNKSTFLRNDCTVFTYGLGMSGGRVIKRMIAPHIFKN